MKTSFEPQHSNFLDDSMSNATGNDSTNAKKQLQSICGKKPLFGASKKAAYQKCVDANAETGVEITDKVETGTDITTAVKAAESKEATTVLGQDISKLSDADLINFVAVFRNLKSDAKTLTPQQIATKNGGVDIKTITDYIAQTNDPNIDKIIATELAKRKIDIDKEIAKNIAADNSDDSSSGNIMGMSPILFYGGLLAVGVIGFFTVKHFMKKGHASS